MDQNSNQTWWEQRARRLALRVNLGWWLDRFLPAMLSISVLFAVLLLVLRRAGFTSVSGLVGGYAALLGIAALVCCIAVRRRCFSVRDGLIRLEARQRLHNRLTAAACGVGDWPPPAHTPDDGLAWQWRRLLAQPAVAALMLAAAAWIPIQPEPAAAARMIEEPLAWREMEGWIDTLSEQAPVEPEPLQTLREQIEQLRTQPMDTWYNHGSLEATDSLKQQTARSINELARDLQSAQSGLAALDAYEEAMPAATAEKWKAFMAEALKGLQSGTLSIDPSLLEALESIDPSNLRPLSAEELAALKKALEQGLQACSACEGTGTNLVAAVSTGWGRGGINRGPGEAPLFLKDRDPLVETTGMEGLQNPNFDRAALGDTLAVGQTEHEIDESLYAGPVAAGSVDAAAEGGEAVWRTTLDPEEQEVLKRYFK